MQIRPIGENQRAAIAAASGAAGPPSGLKGGITPQPLPGARHHHDRRGLCLPWLRCFDGKAVLPFRLVRINRGYAPNNGVSAGQKRLDVNRQMRVAADQMGRTNLDCLTRRIYAA